MTTTAESPVLLVGDTPLRSVDVPDCLDTPAVHVRECNGTLYTTMWPAIDTELGALAADDEVGFVNPLPLVCTKIMVCPAVADGIGIYADTSHISPDWALHVAPAFEELLEPALNAIGMKSAPLAQGHQPEG